MKMLPVILTLWSFSSLSQIDYNKLLIARNTGTKVLANGQTIGTMGFALGLMDVPRIPGPLIEVNEGDSVHIDLWNISQGAPHTIHLHGLDVDQQNDGVPHLSFDVGHMDHGHYYFKAPHAGTYLYHCHVVSTVHVQAGMYGMLIIHPTDGSATTWNGGYGYDVTMPILFSEIDTVWHNDAIMKHDHDTSLTIHTLEVPLYHPQFYLINGFSDGQIVDSLMHLNTSVGSLNYLRLANIGYKGVRVIFPAVFNANLIDSDGRPLPSNVVGDTIEVYPGERYGVLGTMPAEGIDQIAVEYIDMNTGNIESIQYLPIVVSGYVSQGGLMTDPQNLKVLPNPNSGKFTVEVGGFKGAKIRINLLDLKGNLVKELQTEMICESEPLQLTYMNQNLPAGAYFVQLVADGNPEQFEKIIITR